MAKAPSAWSSQGPRREKSESAADLAIKICRESTDVEAEVRRFVALSAVPHIVRLLDIQVFKVDGKGRPFLGMVFPKYSCDLRECLLRNTKLREAGIRHIVKSVLEALKHIHHLGLVHDLKPANILLRARPRFQQHWDSLTNRSQAEPPAASALPPEVRYQLPAFFEVRSAPSKRTRSFLPSVFRGFTEPRGTRYAAEFT